MSNHAKRGTSLVTEDGSRWRVEETFVTGPDDERLARIPGHISYWFAWDGYMGLKSSLFGK